MGGWWPGAVNHKRHGPTSGDCGQGPPVGEPLRIHKGRSQEKVLTLDCDVPAFCGSAILPNPSLPGLDGPSYQIHRKDRTESSKIICSKVRWQMTPKLKIARNARAKTQEAAARDFNGGEKTQGRKDPAERRQRKPGAGCGSDGQISSNSGAGMLASGARSPSPPGLTPT